MSGFDARIAAGRGENPGTPGSEKPAGAVISGDAGGFGEGEEEAAYRIRREEKGYGRLDAPD